MTANPSAIERPALLVILILCLGALSGCGGPSEDGPATTGSVSLPDLPRRKVPASARAAFDTAPLAPSFAVFRGPLEGEDEIRKRFPYGLVKAMGLKLAAARYSRQLDGKPAYLVPAKGLVCLYTDSEAVGSCWKPNVIKAGRAVASTLCGPGLDADHVVTFGLVPDGIEEVTIVRTNVPSVTVPVEGNLFVGRSSSKPPLPIHVAWTRAGKKVVRSSGIPPAVARHGCRANADAHPGGRPTRP